MGQGSRPVLVRSFEDKAVLAGKRTLLWLGDHPTPANVSSAAAADWDLTIGKIDKPLGPQFKQAKLVLIGANGSATDPRWLDGVLGELDRTSVVGVFLLRDDARAAWSLLANRMGNFLCVSEGATAGELAAKLAAAGALQRGIENLCAELSTSRTMGSDGTQDIEEEMRLASRLQRDFLPKQLPEVGGLRFGALYKPAGWVSGDIYDIMRLDETHLGFYVADVVGHGMPAALLTMFIKKALLTKRIAGRTYEIVSPAASLAALNNDICEQDLSSCQFCTAVYCVMDAENLMLTYSRAGHPEPIILRAAGTVDMRRTPGSLLGIFPGEKFYPTDVKLCRGDRLLLYSDGAECGLFGQRRCNEEQIRQGAIALAGLSLDEMFAQISARINADRAANGAEDDVTVVVMDVG